SQRVDELPSLPHGGSDRLTFRAFRVWPVGKSAEGPDEHAPVLARGEDLFLARFEDGYRGGVVACVRRLRRGREVVAVDAPRGGSPENDAPGTTQGGDGVGPGDGLAVLVQRFGDALLFARVPAEDPPVGAAGEQPAVRVTEAQGGHAAAVSRPE